ncbi:hypothetical protein ACJMK2_034719 [Sinanodonta woodiana]|uniref:Sodium-coupled monocarboxylate transporter 1 n=1 Tax=Sinanodonta woodiana TaxID=1069815 RepID=A0ABD3WWK9_SINWO
MAGLVFRTIDYCVMAAFLLFSLALGLYYGCWKKQTTPEEYLLGNRKMHLIPVALSLLVTYASAISVMGVPAEVYLYDSMMLHLYVGFSLSYLITAFTIVPLVYPLRITSAYEYLGQRFQSRAVQLLGASIGILQTVLYMSVVLYAPALALEAVAGIPLWVSIVVVGIVGTIYTALGGIKSVIWTDVLQCIVLYVGIIATLVLGITKVGSVQTVIDIARQGGRTNLSTGSLDFTVRHTLLSCIVGGIFNWIPNCCNQSAIQRISAMKSSRQAQIAILLNVPLILVYGVILIFTGMVLYAYFVVRDCDPVTAGYVANGNQVLPYFVIDIMRDVPGLAGVFIAALFSGALSSLSSGINAMAANTVEDILGGMFKEATQTRITLFAKIIVLVYGLISVGLAYGARNLKGSIVQVALSAMGAAGGPVSGLFFLGGIFPQANWIGAFSGGIISLAITIWIAVGSVLYGKAIPLSPPPSTSGCMAGLTSNVSDIISSFTAGEQLTTVDYFYTSSITTFLETHSSSDVTAIRNE